MVQLNCLLYTILLIISLPQQLETSTSSLYIRLTATRTVLLWDIERLECVADLTEPDAAEYKLVFLL